MDVKYEQIAELDLETFVITPDVDKIIPLDNLIYTTLETAESLSKVLQAYYEVQLDMNTMIE